MATHVALLRAVNVGGSGKLPMKDLRLLCDEAGFESVQTHIASGNVVFRSTDPADRVRSLLERRLEDYGGLHVDVLVRSAREMLDLLEANPYKQQPGNQVAVLFLDQQPPVDLSNNAKGVAGELFEPAAREIFIHYPEGLGRSKLAFDGLGVGTTRNMNTVAKLAAMAAEI